MKVNVLSGNLSLRNRVVKQILHYDKNQCKAFPVNGDGFDITVVNDTLQISSS